MSNIAVASNRRRRSVRAEETPAEPHDRPQLRRPRPLRLRVHSALRWLHIYTSMVSLVIVLFFAATGVTLNHPDWLATERTSELTDTLPATWRPGGGANVDWLTVAEELRAHGVHGTPGDRSINDREATISFRAPGYSADALIDVSDGSYRLTTSYQGLMGVINDLHRGRDAGHAWGWVIDVAGVFLVLLSLTGLGLLFYLRKVRMRGLMTLGAGAVIIVWLASLAR